MPSSIHSDLNHPDTGFFGRMFLQQLEEYKQVLRNGKMIRGERATGKTAAIMEVIHEDFMGKALIGLPNWNLVECFISRYRHLFPDDGTPYCFVVRRSSGVLRGREHVRNVFVDVFDLVDFADVDEFASQLVYLGGNLKGSY